MKILVLGAGGFIGKNLTNKLLEDKENEIILFDRKSTRFEEKIIRNRRILIKYGNFDEECDYVSLTAQVDIVYHLISTSNPTSANTVSEDIKQNALPTVKLLDACVKNSVRRFIFLSSGGTVYGIVKEIPIKESHERNPICVYGIHKLLIERIIEYYNYQYSLDYRIIRMANPYGRYQNPTGGLGAITTFAYKMLKNEKIHVFGNGEAIRDYIYIEDAVYAIINIAVHECEEKVFNVGSGLGYSVNDILAILKKRNPNIEIEYIEKRKTDVPINILDIERYEKYYGKMCKYSMEEGIDNTIKYLEDLNVEKKNDR